MKSFKLLMFLLMMAGFVACDPLEDELQEIEDNKAAPSAILDITLEDADYEDIIPDDDDDDFGRFKNFSNLDDVKTYVPGLIVSKYPVLGEGSFANVSYNFYQGSNSLQRSVERSETYWYSDDDYALINESVGATGFFYPSNPVDEDVLASSLETSIQDASEGDVYGVSYKYSSIDPILDFTTAGIQEVHKEEFAADISAYEAVSIAGDEVFEYNMFFNGNAAMSGYNGSEEPNEDWLVSPSIDLSGLTEASLKFYQVINFLDVSPEEILLVKVSSDYDGDVETASWTDLTVDQWPAGNSWSEEVWSTMDISAFDNMVINVAFVYNTTVTLDAPTWEIGEVVVEAVSGVSITELASPMRYTDYFEYSGSEWEKIDNVYGLINSDYDAMGAPGRFNNFSSSSEAEDYLPNFLISKYPYSFEGEEVVISYKYWTGSEAQTRADHYTFDGTVWNEYSSVIEQSLSFAHDGESWKADNTIAEAVDMSAFGELEGGDRGANVADFGTFYQGSNTTGGTWWSDEEILAGLINYCNNVYAGSDVGQKYLLSYVVYLGGGADETRETRFIKGEDGDYTLFEE